MKKLVLLLLSVAILATMPMVGYAENQDPFYAKTKPLSVHIRNDTVEKRRPLYVNGEWRHYWGILQDGVHYIDVTQLRKIFGITEMNPDLLEKAIDYSVWEGYPYVPIGELPKYYPNIQLYFEPVTKSIVMTTDGTNPETNLPKEVQERILALPALKKELEELRKTMIKFYPDSVNNCEPYPIYKGSYDRELTERMNWLWMESNSCWIKSSGAHYYIRGGYKQEKPGAFVIYEGCEEKFFKYYKLYGLPENIYKVNVEDYQENLINISDYLGGYQYGE